MVDRADCDWSKLFHLVMYAPAKPLYCLIHDDPGDNFRCDYSSMICRHLKSCPEKVKRDVRWREQYASLQSHL
jgi:hypothetical protein